MKKPLKEGKVYCDRCKGHGTIKSFKYYKANYNGVIKNQPYEYNAICHRCKTVGQLDWLEIITGVTRKPEFEEYNDLSIIFPEIFESSSVKLILEEEK